MTIETPDVELDDSVASARASNLRETNPELYGEEAKAPDDAAAADAGTDAGTAAAGEKTDDAPAGDTADAGAKPGDEQQHIPRARLNEVVQEKKDALAERDALRARLAEIEAEQQAAAAKAAELPARDIEAEMDELDAKYDAGDIDSDERRAQMKVLQRDLRKQLAEEATAAALQAVEQRDTQRAAQTQAEQWQEASDRFMADPKNAAYKEPIRIAALNEAMKAVDTERGGKITYDDLLKEARNRVEVAFGGSVAAEGAETPQQKVARERREAAARAAAEASALPDRPSGGVGARGTDATKDVENISRAEWRKLPQSKRDELLGKIPASA